MAMMMDMTGEALNVPVWRMALETWQSPRRTRHGEVLSRNLERKTRGNDTTCSVPIAIFIHV